MTAAGTPCPRPADALRIIRKLARRVFVKPVSQKWDVDSVEMAAFKAGLDELLPHRSVYTDKKLSDLTMAAYLLESESAPDGTATNADWLGYDAAQTFFERRALSKPALDRYDAMQRLWLLDALALDERLPDDGDMIAVFAVIRDDIARLAPESAS